MAAQPALLADIGGTNTRLALLDNGEIGPLHIEPTGRRSSLTEALQAFLDGRKIGAAAIAVAAPVGDGAIRLTNAGWTFSAEDLSDALDVDKVTIVNDFVAQAAALPRLRDRDLVRIGGGHIAEGCPRVVLGAGTGLGVAALVPAGSGWIPVSTEAGHVTLAAMDAEEDAVIAVLRARYGHVSAERVLSGPGLMALVAALSGLTGTAASFSAPHEITAAAQADAGSLAGRAVDLFCRFFGTVAADLALTYGAGGGVYISGGIVPRLGDAFIRSSFRERFESKGRFTDYLQDIPTYVVMAEHPAFIGLKHLIETPPQR